MLHALVLGIVGAAGTWNRDPEFGPKWYPLALVATTLPCACVGGRICVAQLRARAAG